MSSAEAGLEVEEGETHMLEQLKNLIKDEEAPTAVEYAIMVAGIAVAVMTAVFLIGTNMNTKFGEVNTRLTQ
jgi:pilus assembly protein Flp/PilA